jgi:hypothetical protein
MAQFKGLALLVVCLYKLHVKEVIFAWQAWMHELQMEDHFSTFFRSCQTHNFV